MTPGGTATGIAPAQRATPHGNPHGHAKERASTALVSKVSHPSGRGFAALAVLVAMLAAGLIGYELTRPNVLTGVVTYDEGVYLGGTLRLLHGALPYRDFAYLPPPGLLLFLSPVVALGHLAGDRGAMEAARLLTGVVAVVNVALVAYLVRYRGVVAVVTSGIAAAALPAAVAADSTLLIDPFYVLFCLIGALILFDSAGSFSVGTRRILLGGMAFGFACSIQLWAAGPIVAVVLASAAARIGRRRFGALLGGLVSGAVIPTLPFFALAPGAFVHDVLVVQLSRTAESAAAVSIGERLRVVTGVGLVPGLDPPTALAVAIIVVLAVLVLAVLALPGRRDLDWFAAAAAALSVVAVCVSPEFYALYGYFPGIFLALALGVVVGRMGDLIREQLRVRHTRRTVRPGAIQAGVVGSLLIVGVVFVTQDSGYAHAYLAGTTDPGPQLALRIPADACVAFDEATLAADAGRFPTTGRCPAMVDPFAQWLADDPAHPAPYAGPYDPSLVTQWSTALHRADFLLEVAPRSDFIPWTSELVGYFDQNYVLVYSQPGAVLYERTTALYAR